jgi:hypothetical protein
MHDLIQIREQERIFSRWREALILSSQKMKAIKTKSEARAFRTEILQTRRSWNSDLDAWLDKSPNLASAFEDFGERASIRLLAAAGVGLFAGPKGAFSSMGGSLAYDLVTSLNKLFNDKKARRTAFSLNRMYMSFDGSQKTPEC